MEDKEDLIEILCSPSLLCQSTSALKHPEGDREQAPQYCSRPEHVDQHGHFHSSPFLPNPDFAGHEEVLQILHLIDDFCGHNPEWKPLLSGHMLCKVH